MKKPRSDVIPLAEEPAGSRFTWLYTQLRTAVLEGRLAPGSRMASTRALAQTYGIARGTVVEVFEQLSAEGYLHGKSGSGTYVATSLPDEWIRVAASSGPAVRRAAPRSTLSERGRVLSRTTDFSAGSRPRAFQAHRPALDSTTVAVWQRISSRRRVRDAAFFSHNDRRGYRPLRSAVADYLRHVRGVRCVEDRVLIFSGVLPALDLATRLLADAGDAVLIEDPGFTGVRAICEANGLRVFPLPVDAEGADIEAIDLEARNARLAFVSPAHQYPLGMTLSVRRRLALLTWAARSGGYILEDDYDGEYRFAGRPIAALQGLDENQCVIYSGTFNKVLFPSLRLSYLVVPEHLVDAFGAARATIDRYPALAPQMVLCDFITEGHFTRHLRRMRELYAERLDFFQRLVEERLGDELQLDPVSTGLQVVAWLRKDGSDATLAGAAEARDVEALPLSSMRLQRPLRNGLVLGFAGFERSETLRGIDGLQEAIKESQPAAVAR